MPVFDPLGLNTVNAFTAGNPTNISVGTTLDEPIITHMDATTSESKCPFAGAAKAFKGEEKPSLLKSSTKNAMDYAMLGMLGAGFLTAGVMPAFADGDIKTYSSFINFLTNDWKFNPFLQHGYNMWVAWFVLGSSQVASVRYLKGSWPNINMWVHRIGGSAMVVLTSYFGYKAISTVGKVINNEHSYFVFPIMLSVLLVAAFGSSSLYDVRLSTNNQWNTKIKLDEKKMHTYPAYGTLAASLFAMSYGMHYYRISPKHYSDVPIEWYQVALTIFTVLAAEAYYQYSIKDERPFLIENTNKISVAQF